MAGGEWRVVNGGWWGGCRVSGVECRAAMCHGSWVVCPWDHVTVSHVVGGHVIDSGQMCRVSVPNVLVAVLEHEDRGLEHLDSKVGGRPLGCLDAGLGSVRVGREHRELE